jgi:4a-hydroxytetrahydrobiopterin dehydratase
MTELLLHEAVLAELPAGWEIDSAGNALVKTFRFPDFASAFSWMTHVALVSEKINHHPKMLYVYKTVEAYLTTHDAGGITRKDITFAQKMNEAARHD